jgi:hypothetical protein
MVADSPSRCIRRPASRSMRVDQPPLDLVGRPRSLISGGLTRAPPDDELRSGPGFATPARLLAADTFRVGWSVR